MWQVPPTVGARSILPALISRVLAPDPSCSCCCCCSSDWKEWTSISRWMWTPRISSSVNGRSSGLASERSSTLIRSKLSNSFSSVQRRKCGTNRRSTVSTLMHWNESESAGSDMRRTARCACTHCARTARSSPLFASSSRRQFHSLDERSRSQTRQDSVLNDVDHQSQGSHVSCGKIAGEVDSDQRYPFRMRDSRTQLAHERVKIPSSGVEIRH